ncbi:MAG: type II secretion system secretin GspD [Bdellovibrio sp.]|nr:type II secretion system secretin GspD [Bdellovibrio sp.]
MRSVTSPVDSSTNQPSADKPSRVAQDLDWHERLAGIACWIGIFGLILLVSRGVFAADSNRPSLLPGARPFGNPLGDNAASKMNTIEDDEDFDDEDDDFFPNTPPSAQGRISQQASAAGAQKTFSAGGTPHSGPNPTVSDKGVSVGGANPNGVIPRSKPAPLLKVDDDTAEGSKAIVTDFNFPDADILDIAKTLGKLTGKNFILDKDVKGKITIISNSPITVSDAWKAFLTSLDINGFALIPSGKYIRISRQRDARDKQLRTFTGESSPDTDALITRVFPLKYINAEEVSRTFRSFVPANARIIPYDQTNTIIVTDTGSNITKLAKMLEILDVEGFDAGIEVIPVKIASAVELSKLIDALIPGTGTPTSGGAGGAPRFGASGGGRFSARRTKEGGIINTIIADERTNTLIVHANAKGADQVRELVAKLDQKIPTSTGGGKVHVVYLSFADAEQVANTLNAFSSQASTAAKPTGSSGGGGGGPSGVGTNPVESTLFQGSIKISPDKATNSLVITASPADFVTVKRVIDRLDIPRDQVYVEIVIMEVNVNRGFTYSANLLNAPLTGYITSATDIASLFSPNGPFAVEGATIPVLAGAGTTMQVGGVSYPISSVTGLIKVLQKTGNSNVLATPQIIALDNTEANFESAEKVPTLSSNAVQGAIQSSVNFQNVAISIKIKPQINKATNFVKLDITAKLGDISNRPAPKGVADIAVGTTERSVQTTVVVGDTDTVVLGGLIRDKITENINKIPILGDIPLLGWLFKSKINSVDKTNLLVFMTPRIIRQYEKIRSILDRKLKERDDFLEAYAGGEDALRHVRDGIVRSLPDLKELTENKPANTFTIDEEKPVPGAVEAARPRPASPVTEGQFNPEGRIPAPAPTTGPTDQKFTPTVPGVQEKEEKRINSGEGADPNTGGGAGSPPTSPMGQPSS